MQTENRLLDDLARAASGALGALAGVRGEIEAQLRSRLEAWLKAQMLVERGEFEAVKAMAAKARLENEALAARLADLEKKLAAQRGYPAPPRRPQLGTVLGTAGVFSPNYFRGDVYFLAPPILR